MHFGKFQACVGLCIGFLCSGSLAQAVGKRPLAPLPPVESPTASTPNTSDHPTWFGTDWDNWFEQVADDKITTGNHVDLLVHGNVYYPLRLDLMRNARKSIDMQAYLWCNDEVGITVANELVAAHQRGVRVRVIVD